VTSTWFAVFCLERLDPASVADLTFLSALPRVIRRNVKSKATLESYKLLVSLWFRRSYGRELKGIRNVGTGTPASYLAAARSEIQFYAQAGVGASLLLRRDLIDLSHHDRLDAGGECPIGE